MAAFLKRALDLPATETDYFEDDQGSLNEDAINRLAAAGVTQGCRNDFYCPHDPIERAQIKAFLTRALDLAASEVDFFTDDARSSHEAAINSLAADGATSGCGGRVVLSIRSGHTWPDGHLICPGRSG